MSRNAPFLLQAVSGREELLRLMLRGQNSFGAKEEGRIRVAEGCQAKQQFRRGGGDPGRNSNHSVSFVVQIQSELAMLIITCLGMGMGMGC